MNAESNMKNRNPFGTTFLGSNTVAEKIQMVGVFLGKNISRVIMDKNIDSGYDGLGKGFRVGVPFKAFTIETMMVIGVRLEQSLIGNSYPAVVADVVYPDQTVKEIVFTASDYMHIEDDMRDAEILKLLSTSDVKLSERIFATPSAGMKVAQALNRNEIARAADIVNYYTNTRETLRKISTANDMAIDSANE